ncbi:nicotinate-nucleotide--dimethylbenzimidazole phosphoribosyltransferase [Streptomyces sp. NPDC006692]|uniref:nicotinate-nucleotide--dimethylbenzimidazole phosphoribosyltransferase n=1 Tax=Streptomyces sp. NPDC006692 TaxID=3364758 RepID=UPI0036B0895C
MTDTGQVPGEGLPENAGMVEQPGVPAPGAYTFLDPADSSANTADDDDLLLMPGAQGAWIDPQSAPAQVPPLQAAPAEPGAHETGGRDTGSVDLGGVRVAAQAPATAAPPPARRPLHLGPQVPDASSGVVRSLADRGPAAGAPVNPAPVRTPGPVTAGPEYLDVPREEPAPQLMEFPPQPGMAWTPQQRSAPHESLNTTVPPAETVVPEDFAVRAQVPAVQPQPAEEAAQAASGPVAQPALLVDQLVAQQAAPQSGQPQPVGQFVPVEGSLPSAPHLSPAPVQAAAAPQSPGPQHEAEQPEAQQPQPQQQAPEPVAVPAQPEPVAAEPVVPAPAEPVAVGPAAPEAPAAMPAAEPVAVEPAAEPAVAEAVPAEPVPAPAEPLVAQPLAEAVPPQAVAAEAAPAEAPAAEPEPLAVAVAQSPAPIAVAVPAAEVPEAASPEAAGPEAVSQEQAPQPVAQTAPEPPQPVIEAPASAAEPTQAPEPVPVPRQEQPAAVAEPVVQAAPEAPAAVQEVLEVSAAPQSAAEPEPVAEPLAGTAPADADAADGTAGNIEAPEQAAAPGYDDAEREAVLRVMRERRDIRNGFRSDPIPHEVLLRVLEAAHTAPSVGHSQPWDFVVIRSAETRRTMHELAQRQREAYAKSLPKGRAKQFKELKIEAILETPVNIVVTADPTRGGRHTLGRYTQPQMAPYSSALAVENLWLAARAEGLGVGWVSFFDEREMVRSLGLPEHLEVVAYLCVGYVDEFPDEPELMQAGWSKRRPLAWVVHEETYGRRALPGEDPHDLLEETVAGIRPLDAKALGEAWERQKRMTKPAGALGMLEIISAQLAGLSRKCPPPIPEPAAVAIFAGDHGVHAQGVTPWPQEVTGQMVANFLGGGAVCNAFANQVGAEVCVIDVGVASELPATPGLLPRKVRPGTADMTAGPAMTREEAVAAIEVGIETARDLVAAGNKALLTGEMGIANTTVSAALISLYTGVDAAEVTGRGTGINDETHARKVDVVRRALELHQPDPADPIGVLAAIGGLEHAALVGFLLGGASLRTPVILDGVSTGAAALVARAIAPEVLSACIAGHRSAEPGHVAALNKLGLRPLVDLDLRLGEGTGALLALPVVQSAARAMHEVATFDSAGVTEK